MSSPGLRLLVIATAFAIQEIHAGTISWSVFDITGEVSDVSTEGILVEARTGADGGELPDEVDGGTLEVNGVTFNDGYTLDRPSNTDTLNARCGIQTNRANARYYDLLKHGDRLNTGDASITFDGLKIGNTYQIQIWVSDTISMPPGDAGIVLSNVSGVAPDPGKPGHAVLLMTSKEKSPGQFALGTFVADASSQSFALRKWTGLKETPKPATHTFVNAVQLRDLGGGGSSGSQLSLASAGETVLIGGFDGTNALSAPKQSAGLTGLKVELTTNAPDTNKAGQMLSTLWGSADLDPDADNTGTKEDRSVVRGGTALPWTFSLKITNNTGFDVELGKLHYITKKDTADGPEEQMITYVSGDLDDSTGSHSGVFDFANGIKQPCDIDLSRFLNDVTLSGHGESAVFTWSHGKAKNPSGNTTVRIDNIALSGTLLNGSGDERQPGLVLSGGDPDYKTWGERQGWSFGTQGTSKEDDYDNDGLTNDVERIFGLDPTDSSSTNPYISGFNDAEGTFVYTRRDQESTDLKYSVWYTADNQQWSLDSKAIQTAESLGNGVEKVTVKISPELLSKPQLSVQIRVEK